MGYKNSKIKKIFGVILWGIFFFLEQITSMAQESLNKQIIIESAYKMGSAPFYFISKELIHGIGAFVILLLLITIYVLFYNKSKRAEVLQERIEEEIKYRNQAIEYDRLKTEFFSNISHELKTPLNLILGTAQLLEVNLRDELPVDVEKNTNKNLKILKQNSYRLLRYVNNLIDITKIDTNDFQLNLKNYNIVRIVEETTLSVAHYIENKEIDLRFDTDIEEKIIVCDFDKIERIILNLLSNAVKFTNPGGSIMVKLSDRGEFVVISVKDTGRGIPRDKAEDIFERFRQVDKSFTRNHEGSGIGLSIVKSLVEMHKGKIFINTELEKGSEFIIELPATKLTVKETEIMENIKQSCVERIYVEFSDIYE